MDTAKPQQVRVYLDETDLAVAEELSSAVGEQPTWLCRKIVVEGLRALREQGTDQLTFPFRFRIEHGKHRKAQAA